MRPRRVRACRHMTAMRTLDDRRAGAGAAHRRPCRGDVRPAVGPGALSLHRRGAAARRRIPAGALRPAGNARVAGRPAALAELGGAPAGQPPLGYVQATVLDDGSAWVAYLLGSAHQGRGHATRATAAMLAHLESEYGATRLLANVEAENLPSIRLLQRLGFRAATADGSRPARADGKRADLRARSARQRRRGRPAAGSVVTAPRRAAGCLPPPRGPRLASARDRAPGRLLGRSAAAAGGGPERAGAVHRCPRASQRRGHAAGADAPPRRRARGRVLGAQQRQRVDRRQRPAPSRPVHRLRLDLARASGLPAALGPRRPRRAADARRAARLGSLSRHRRDLGGALPFARTARGRLRPERADRCPASSRWPAATACRCCCTSSGRGCASSRRCSSSFPTSP